MARCPLLAEVGRSTPLDGRALRVPLVMVRLGVRNRQCDGDDGSVAAGRGQFRWRSWPVAVANVGRWLAFCNQTILGEMTLRVSLYGHLNNEVVQPSHPEACEG